MYLIDIKRVFRPSQWRKSNMKPRNEQRQSVRCAVADVRRQSTFITKAGAMPAILLDESAGGFAVALEQSPPVKVGDMAGLQTDTGLYQVQVANIRMIEPPEDVAVAHSQQAWYRVGLVRLGEVPPEEPPVSFSLSDLSAHGPQWYANTGVLVFAGLFLTAAAVVVAAWLALSGRYMRPVAEAPLSGTANPWVGPASEAASAKEDFSEGRGFTPPPDFERVDTRFDPAQSLRGSSGKGLSTSATRTKEAILVAVRRLPGATAMVLPDVAEELKLSEEQRRRIQELVDAVVEAIRMLDLQAAEQQLSREEIVRRRQELHAAARQKALELLTPEQQAHWEKLLGGKDGKHQKAQN